MTWPFGLVMWRGSPEIPESAQAHTGHVIHLMKFSGAGRNVTSLHSTFGIETKFSLMFTSARCLRSFIHISVLTLSPKHLMCFYYPFHPWSSVVPVIYLYSHMSMAYYRRWWNWHVIHLYPPIYQIANPTSEMRIPPIIVVHLKTVMIKMRMRRRRRRMRE